MLETAAYRKKLSDVLTKIEGSFDTAKISGRDIGSFIFAEKGNRALEVYQSDTTVIVEFWLNQEQEMEIEVESYEKAINLVIDWIKRNENK